MSDSKFKQWSSAVGRLRAARSNPDTEARRKERQERYNQFANLNWRYQKRMERREWLEDQDNHTINRADPIKRDIQKRYEIYGDLVGETEVPEIPPDEPTEDEFVDYDIAMDRRENVLYNLYSTYRFQEGLDEGKLDYIEFSDVAAGRALVRLLCYYHRGTELLAQLYDPSEYKFMPRKQDAEAFVNAGGMWIADPTADESVLAINKIPFDDRRNYYADEFLARLFQQVPGSRKAVGRILSAYGKEVRDVRAKDPTAPKTPLPDEVVPEGPPVTWDQLAEMLGIDDLLDYNNGQVDFNLEKAVTAYLNGSGLKEAHRKHRVSRAKLEDALRERNLLRKRGKKPSNATT